MRSSAQAVTLVAYIREVPGSKLGQEAIITINFSMVFISHYK
jgi:hypothetical protein